MLKHFEAMFLEVRKYMWSGGYKKTGVLGTNPKEKDVTTGFDKDAEDIVIGYCKREGLPVVVYSEESGRIDVAPGKPEYRIDLDPVDGSTAIKKGIEGSAFCAALSPYRKDGILVPDDVMSALIGSIISGAVVRGERGRGVIYKGPFSGFREKPVHGSKNTDLARACIEIDMDFALNEASNKIEHEEGLKIRRIVPIIGGERGGIMFPRRIKYLRRSAADAIGYMYVPTGAVDSYIDVRDVSTPENWIGAQMLAVEAGGEFTDWHGNKIRAIKDVTKPYSYVLSGNPVIHEKIIRLLNEGLQ